MDPVTAGVLANVATQIVVAGTGQVWRKLRGSAGDRALRDVIERTLHRAIEDARTTDDVAGVAWQEGVADELGKVFRGDVARLLVSSLDLADADDRTRRAFDDRLRAAVDNAGAELTGLRDRLDLDHFLRVLPDILVDEVIRGAGTPQDRVLLRMLATLVDNTRPVVLPDPSPEQRREDAERLLRQIIGATEDPRRLPRFLPLDHDVGRSNRPVRIRTEVRRAPAVERDAVDEAGSATDRRYRQPGDSAVGTTVSWQEYVDTQPRVVVLGDPGMGKSWLVRMETRRLAEIALARLDDGRTADEVTIPVSARCDELAGAEGDTIGAALTQVMSRRHRLPPSVRTWLAGRIDSGGAAILLDAWDELREETARNRVRDLLADVSADDDGAGAQPCVITSRIAGYTGSPLARPVTEVELLPFEPDDVDATVAAWGLTAEAERRLRARLGEPAAAGMARNPLLLSLLCSVAGDDKPLPTVRWQLLERIIGDLLIIDRARPATGGGRTPEEVAKYLRLCGAIALHAATSQGSWTDSMTTEDIVGVLRHRPELDGDPYAFVHQLVTATGLLTPVGSQADGASSSHLFVHRTIAEYLVARELALLPAAEWRAVLDRHLWFDPDWSEVIPMLGGKLRDPAPLLDHLLALSDDPFHIGLRTAARIVSERPDAASAQLTGLVEQIVGRLLKVRSTEPFEESATAALAALTPVVDASVLAPLLDLLDDDGRFSRAHIADALAPAVGRDDVRRALLTTLVKLQDRPYLATHVVKALAGAAERDDVRVALLRFLTHADSSRPAAVRALAGAIDRRDVRGALSRFLRDDDWSVRHAVHEVLADSFHRSDVRSAFVDLLDEHSDQSVRLEAVQSLRGAVAYDDVRAALVRVIADAEGSSDVLRVVAGSLSAVVDDDEVRRALLRLLRSASDDQVRGAAAAALTGARHDEGVRQQLAAWSDDWRAARTRDQRHVRDEAGSFLVRVLQQHDDPDVREYAIRVLAGRSDPSSARTPILLRLWDDPEARVRAVAAKALAGTLGPLPDEVRAACRQLPAGVDPEAWEPPTPAWYAPTGAGELHQAYADLLARDHDLDVRSAAVRGLAEGIDRPVARELLSRLLGHDHPPTRRQAARVLTGFVPHDDVSRVLLDRLSIDDHDDVREAAADALARAEDERTRLGLLDLLHSHPNRSVRGLAVEALGWSLHDPRVCRAVLDQLTRNDLRAAGRARTVLRSDGLRSTERLEARLLTVCKELESASFITKVAACGPLEDLAVTAYPYVAEDRRSYVRSVLATVTRAADEAS